MSLVANYSDSDSDEADTETTNETKAVDHISDEEDFHHDQNNGGKDDYFEEEQDVFSIISQLPIAKVKATTEATYVDEAEDVSTIPAKKDYGDKIEEPPAKKKKKRDGPVRIVLPALEKLEEEDSNERRVKVEPSKTGSGLFALLPEPKRSSFTRKPTNSALNSSQPPALATNPNENNLKPQGVRKVGLVPHRVANPVKVAAKKDNSDDSDDDDGDYLNVQSSYFPAGSSDKPVGVGVSSRMTINPVPAHVEEDHHHLHHHQQQPDILGPAVAPYPPPAPYQDLNQREFVESEEAIMRLAGKQNKLKEDSTMKFIEVNEADMRGDPRDWMTKAMTEEQAPRPSGKGPKGLARSRHQITYLAHQAKERDWELRQDWATSRENRKASANKYGF